MAEDKPDKESQTEEPTEHKLRQAEEKGNLPFSRELPIFVGLIGFSLIVSFVALPAFSDLASFLLQLIERPQDWHLTRAEDFKNLMLIVATKVGTALAPILIIIMLGGLVASMIQHAPRFVGERIRPKFSRISPAGGFSRIYSKSGLVEFLKSLVKLIGVSLIVYLIFFHGNTIFITALLTEGAYLPHYIHDEISRLIIANTVGVVVIAAFDLVWSRFSWRRNLRMSKQEIKDEHKQMEGNPMVKARMRSIGRDRARRQMMANVPKATLIIANPTHFSVALRYAPPQDSAPVVIAKGQDLIALKIREIAAAHHIPVIENVTLARALYKQAKIDQMIDPEFYQAVAEIIRYINNNSYHRLA